MKKLLGILVLGLLWCNVGVASETLFFCKDKLNDSEVLQGFNFEKMLMTRWNDQVIPYHPMVFLNGKYIWVEERDNVNDPKAVKNSRVINYFNKESKELEKWFFPLSDAEVANLQIKIHEGKGITWFEDGPKFVEYQQKIINELYSPKGKFRLNCSIN